MFEPADVLHISLNASQCCGTDNLPIHYCTYQELLTTVEHLEIHRVGLAMGRVRACILTENIHTRIGAYCTVHFHKVESPRMEQKNEKESHMRRQRRGGGGGRTWERESGV
jgi:hypothetical protein